MRVYHSPKSLLHAPSNYYRRGAIVDHPEQARRYSLLRDAAAGAGHQLVEAGDAGLEPIAAVHDADYLAFLETAWSRRGEIPGFGHEIGSSHFARHHMHKPPVGILGQIGYYMADTSTPIQEGTWASIYASAQVAISAADAVSAGQVRHAYALCRPPGHHAFTNSGAGFCFLNNTAIAARRLAARLGGPVAVLDIDVHHGNGTQQIFYADPSVLTVSIHASPENYYPFYIGYADETGSGDGEGFNVNLPLPEGSKDDLWLATIDRANARLRDFAPKAVAVALGFDASEYDPSGAFKVTTPGFARAAELIAGLGLPTVLLQEGGYLSDVLARNLVTFLDRFQATHI